MPSLACLVAWLFLSSIVWYILFTKCYSCNLRWYWAIIFLLNVLQRLIESTLCLLVTTCLHSVRWHTVSFAIYMEYSQRVYTTRQKRKTNAQKSCTYLKSSTLIADTYLKFGNDGRKWWNWMICRILSAFNKIGWFVAVLVDNREDDAVEEMVCCGWICRRRIGGIIK